MQSQNRYLLTSQRTRPSRRHSIELMRFCQKGEIAFAICGPAQYQWVACLRHSSVLSKRLHKAEMRPSKRLLKAACGSYTLWSGRRRIALGVRHSSMRSSIPEAVSLKLKSLTSRGSFGCGCATMVAVLIPRFSQKVAALITGACRECVNALTGLALN